MKCNACGNIGFTATSCPDCGSEDLTTEAGSSSQTTDAVAVNEAPPAMPDMPSVSVPTDVKGPVVGTIVLPDARRIEMREGDEFTIAHTDTDETVTFKSDDETVSRTPVKIFARDGKMFATGGGGNGFSLITTVRYKPMDSVEIPRGANVAVTAGKTARFPIK
ncbi:MAG: hypothetical protein WDN47_04085 [Candidatus Doudnabacteria bacterium]